MSKKGPQRRVPSSGCRRDLCGTLVPKQLHHPRAHRPPGLVGGASLHRIELGKSNAALHRLRIGHGPRHHRAHFGVPAAPIGVDLPGVMALAELFSGFPVQQNIVYLHAANDRASPLFPMSGEARQFRHNSQKIFHAEPAQHERAIFGLDGARTTLTAPLTAPVRAR